MTGHEAQPPAALRQALADAGWVAGPDAAAAAARPLAGGVSCDVWLFERPDGAIVVKQPLARLRVAADWRAPVDRYRSEVDWLRRARGIDRSLAPAVLAELPRLHAFVLEFIPGVSTWRDMLIDGNVDAGFAAAVGARMAGVHAATAGNADDRAAFDTAALFHALRIEPFLLHAADQEADSAPAVCAVLRAMADKLGRARIALIHGDVSPKNILAAASGPMLIDAECATFGDPAFDLAFCTTHLLLKSVLLADPRMIAAATAMVTAYAAGVAWEDAGDLQARAGALTAALLLARIIGKSPAPYMVAAAHRETVLRQARARIVDPLPITRLLAGWDWRSA